jgi:hypothetical protein
MGYDSPGAEAQRFVPIQPSVPINSVTPGHMIAIIAIEHASKKT